MSMTLGETDNDLDGADTFDFERHRLDAEDAYRRVRTKYEEFAAVVESILARSLEMAKIPTTSIQSRAKTVESFGKKASLSKPSAPEEPKYSQPLEEITDLAAARAITFFLSSVRDADACLREEFDIIETIDKGLALDRAASLGYQSVHYLVKLKLERLGLPEYARFKGMYAEVQVRTILQHAWAEIEHDIQYKSVEALPSEIRRRFLALAGMLEIGDREFQEIANAHDRQQEAARSAVATGELGGVEITPDSLKALLDSKFGEDGRMRAWSYEWTTKILKQLGFTTLEEVSKAIAPYDHDAVSRAIFGSRQGQLTRLEEVLRAAMGDNFLRKHPWNNPDNDVQDPTWFTELHNLRIQRLRDAGIEVGSFSPNS